MVGSIKSHTKNFKFIIPEFNVATWHDYIEENFRSIDALFQNLFGINGFSGMWKTNTAYEAGQVLFVGEDNGSIYEGRLVKVINDTNTGGFTTFSEAIKANPKDYEFYTDASSAQIFAELSKSWATHTGSTVKTPEGDDTGEYSAKHYQTLAKGNEERCEMYKNLTDTNAQLTQEAVVSAETFAQNSETSAQNALVSEQNSKTSETNSKTAEQNAKISEQNAAKSLDELENRIVSLEGCIGDIGIAPFGIDETQNKRRYLNGQVISQTQFVAFTNLIKQRILTNPSLATTEENWQSEISLSKLGQCGKFVIDDEVGTVRLPKVVNINGLQDLSLLGSIKAESLPNITGKLNYGDTRYPTNNIYEGAFERTDEVVSGDGYTNAVSSYIVKFNASGSSSTYQDGAPVQQEAIQYPYFIQVATGSEEQADITTEIQLNNPFSLLDYKWSEYEITNASWLLSNGAFHSGTIYVSVYDLLLKIYNGAETKQGVSVKLLTETYEDTDFVLNTSERTFRLPIKVKLASGNRAAGNGITLGLTNGTNNFGVLGVGNVGVDGNTSIYGSNVGTNLGTGTGIGQKQVSIGITTDPTKSGIETSSQDLYLYFYVGETIQDANIIHASQVLSKVANSIDRTSATDKATVVGWGMPDYSAGVSISASGTFTAPSDGIICAGFAGSWAYAAIYLNSKDDKNLLGRNRIGTSDGGNYASVIAPVCKGETYYVDGHSSLSKFFPYKGVNNVR